MTHGAIDDDLPDASREEVIEELVSFPADQVRVERIVSEGQASPDGFWYDQAWGEWVMILRGEAVVRTKEPDECTTLRPGDWLYLPAHRRHRVDRTAPGTLWLAIHGGGQS